MAYVVRGKNGKVVGTYATRGEAERRIAQLKAGAERLRPFQFVSEHSWPGQPRRHAKAARLGHRRAQRSPGRKPVDGDFVLVYGGRGSKGFAVSQPYALEDMAIEEARALSRPNSYGGEVRVACLTNGRMVEVGRAVNGGFKRVEHSWPGQPRRHAKAARLGHRRAQRSPAYSLTRIRLNRGGYTSNGRYFGNGGAPVYQLMANDVYVFRAPTRAEAVATAEAITNLEESGAGMTDILWNAKRVNPTVGKW